MITPAFGSMVQREATGHRRPPGGDGAVRQRQKEQQVDKTLAVERPSLPAESADSLVRRRLVTAACMLAIFMAAVEVTIVATAMPTIVADLGGSRFFTWVFASYLLTQAVTTPIYGRLADIYGRKHVFFAGAAIFLAGSAACGFTWSMTSLVIFRTLQGIGAGCIQSVATTIVGDIYPPAERARVQGWMSGIWALAAVIGPVLGAVIVQQLHWAYVFWINLPIGAVTIALLACFLHEKLQPRQHQIDYLGSLLMMVGLGAVMTVVVQAQSLSVTLSVGLLAVGVAALTALAIQERRVAEPIIPVALLRNRVIAVGNLGSLLIGALLMTVVAFLPTYVQALMGRSAGVAGFVIAVLSVTWSGGSIAAGRLMPKTSYRLTGALGALTLIAGSAFLIALDPASSLTHMSIAALLIGIGMGVCNIVFLIVVQSSVGWGERGIATASTLFTRTIGQTLGAGIGGAILNFGIARRAPEFVDALDQLLQPNGGGSVDAAHNARLIEAVASGLHDIYLVTALLAAATLAVALLLPADFRTPQPGGAPKG